MEAEEEEEVGADTGATDFDLCGELHLHRKQKMREKISSVRFLSLSCVYNMH